MVGSDSDMVGIGSDMIGSEERIRLSRSEYRIKLSRSEERIRLSETEEIKLDDIGSDMVGITTNHISTYHYWLALHTGTS